MEHLNPQSVSLVSRPDAALTVHDPYYIVNGSDENETDAGLLEYVRILRRHKRVVAFSAFIGLILGLLIGIPLKPVFRATTALEVLNLNEDFMNMKQASPTTTDNESYDISEEQTQAKLLGSNLLLDRVFAKLDPGGALLQKVPLASSGWRRWFNFPTPVPMTEREVLLAKAAASLKIEPTKSTRVLEVSVDSKDPNIAAEFANTLVQEFIQQNLETRHNTSQGTGQWLGKEIDDSRSRLQASENALQAYASKSGLIFVDQEAETNIATEKLQQMQQELSKATADRISKESRFELAKRSPPDSLADVLGDQNLQDLRSKVDDQRRQIADLSVIFNPEYSRLKRAEAELVILQTAYDRGRADLLKSIENDYNQAVKRESLLSRTYFAQTKEVTGQDEKEIQYNILKRDVDSNRQLYDMMLQQTKQAAIASAMRASNVRVVDPAQVPENPIFPNFKLNAALGMVAGLLLSIALVVIRERADRTLQQPGDIKVWANLAELGTIPNAYRNIKGTYGYDVQAAKAPVVPQSSIGSGHRALKAHPSSTKVELITLNQKPSVVAEAFRSALTSILFIGENGSRPRVLVFTSASPADGKTTVVTNIALACAEVRMKVLIVDADLRRPRVHNIFNVSNERGLTNLLSEDFSDENLESLIQETNIPGLDVMTGGAPSQAAAHLLYSPNFAALLVKARKEYDMILIDTPPMLQMADARVVGRQADAVVLVARAGKTTRDALMAIKDRFSEDRIRVLGAILNDWDTKRSSSYYSPYSNYRYNQAYYSPQKSI